MVMTLRPLLRPARTLAALTLLGLAHVAWAQSTPNPEDRAGTFKQVQGDVRVERQGVARAAPAPGDALMPGERIVTGEKAGASVVLKDGTTLTLGPRSTADLSRYQFNSTTQEGNFLLDLLQGSVRVLTGLLAKANPDHFQVKTPTAVVGVRGTDFIVETQP